MIKCPFCKAEDIVIATIKKTGKIIVACKECESVYEVDENLKPIFDHDPCDTQYFSNLESLFKTWDDLENVIPYNELKEEYK